MPNPDQLFDVAYEYVAGREEFDDLYLSAFRNLPGLDRGSFASQLALLVIEVDERRKDSELSEDDAVGLIFEFLAKSHSQILGQDSDDDPVALSDLPTYELIEA